MAEITPTPTPAEPVATVPETTTTPAEPVAAAPETTPTEPVRTDGPVDFSEFVADTHFGFATPRINGAGGGEPSAKRGRGGGGGRRGPATKTVYVSVTRKDANCPWVRLQVVMRDVSLRVVEIDHGDGPKPSAPLDLWNDRTPPETRAVCERFAREAVRAAAMARAHLLTDPGVASAVEQAELPRLTDDRTKNMYVVRYCHPQRPAAPGQTKPPRREVVVPADVAAMTPEELVPFGSPTLFFGLVPVTPELLQQYREALASNKPPPRVSFFRTPADELLPPQAVMGREIRADKLVFTIDCLVVSKQAGGSIKLHLDEVIGVPVQRRCRDMSCLTPGVQLATLKFTDAYGSEPPHTNEDDDLQGTLPGL